jgi:hypothetical protein
VGDPGTRITATNTKTKGTASLKLCKVAGVGIADGAQFAFAVRLISTGDTQSRTVAAGSCAVLTGFPGDSTVEVTETLPPGNPAPTITANPTGAQRTCAAPLPARACAFLEAGTTTELSFKNRAPG